MKTIKRTFIFTLVFIVVFSVFITAKSQTVTTNDTSLAFNSSSYYAYKQSLDQSQRPNVVIASDIIGYTTSEDADITLTEYEGKKNVLVWENGVGKLNLNINVATDGVYNIALTYFPIISQTSSNLEFKIYIDGELPFRECAQISLPRIFKDETYVSEEKNDFEVDNRGNDVCPEQIQSPEWITHTLRDDTGANKQPFDFYFTSGEHTITIVSLRDAIAIEEIYLENKEKTVSYKEYKASNKYDDAKKYLKVIEAEKPIKKTSASLYPVTNKSSVSTTPSDPYATKLNSIGGTNWASPLQSLTWEFSVPEDGYYNIGIRFRQNFVRGMYTSRSVLIDGQELFAELSDIQFKYSTKWQMLKLGEEETWDFYLTKGNHTITLTPTTSGFEKELIIVDETLEVLKKLYSSIIMITGTDPDIYRDYYLDEAIPELIGNMELSAKNLKSVSKKMQEIIGNDGGLSANLDRLVEQLEDFLKKPETIPTRISNFQSNISSLASWVLELRAQSLQLDKLYIIGAADEFPETEKSFFESIKFSILEFFSSFVGDYTSIGNAYDKDEAVYIWLTGSRDVAGVLKNIIDSDFTQKTGVFVNANLSTTSLLAAVMADRGPDVALSVARDEPINLAVRNAVVALDEMDGFDEVLSEFSSVAVTPYKYDGHYYGLPVTQNFFVMFCRDDILASLGIEPPKTWQEFYAVAEVLQRNNMNIGIPDLFTTLLFQMGGKLYNDDLTKTSLDTREAYDAFKMYTDFYKQYGIPLFKDDYNRFRTGEFPLVIANYSFYNQLYATAPEIKNVWSMTTIPGFENEDGTINNVSAASGTACVILSGAKDKEKAWEFVKWWVSGETQGRYARQVETMLGVISRATPASVEAMNQIAWTSAEAQTIYKQWENIAETEEIPGSYYTTRNISNAFNTVYYDGTNPREALNVWNFEINSELKRKREEFTNVNSKK